MKKNIFLCALSLTASLLFSAPVLSDIVHFKNGNQIEGTVTSEEGDVVTLKLTVGSVRIARSDIGKIEKKTPPVLAPAPEKKTVKPVSERKDAADAPHADMSIPMTLKRPSPPMDEKNMEQSKPMVPGSRPAIPEESISVTETPKALMAVESETADSPVDVQSPKPAVSDSSTPSFRDFLKEFHLPVSNLFLLIPLGFLTCFLAVFFVRRKKRPKSSLIDKLPV